MSAGIKIMVEAWDGAPFHQIVVTRAESEHAAVNACRRHLAREGAVLLAWDPAETASVELGGFPGAWRVDPESPEGVLFASGRIWVDGRFKKQGARHFAQLDVEPLRARQTARLLLEGLRGAGLVPVLVHDRARWFCRFLGRCLGGIRAGQTRACPVTNDGELESAAALLASDLDSGKTDWCLIAGRPGLVDGLRALGPGRLAVRGVLRTVEEEVTIYAEPVEGAVTFFGDRAARALLQAALPEVRQAAWPET